MKIWLTRKSRCFSESLTVTSWWTSVASPCIYILPHVCLLLHVAGKMVRTRDVFYLLLSRRWVICKEPLPATSVLTRSLNKKPCCYRCWSVIAEFVWNTSSKETVKPWFAPEIPPTEFRSYSFLFSWFVWNSGGMSVC